MTLIYSIEDLLLHLLNKEEEKEEEEQPKNSCSYCPEEATGKCGQCKKKIGKQHTYKIFNENNKEQKLCSTCYGKNTNWGVPPEDQGGEAV